MQDHVVVNEIVYYIKKNIEDLQNFFFKELIKEDRNQNILIFQYLQHDK